LDLVTFINGNRPLLTNGDDTSRRMSDACQTF